MQGMNIFSKDEINNGRQLEVDIAKAFAVLFMIISHVYEYMGIAGDSFASGWIAFFGAAPSAGVFMAAMGIGIAYTKEDSAKSFALRGVRLLLWGYVLNFFRGTLILFAAKMLGISNSYADVSLLDSLMYVDILQFAGVAFLINALLKKMHVKPWGILLCAAILYMLREPLSSLSVNFSKPLQYGMSLFVYIEDRNAFPAFSWYIYPVIGYCFGILLKHVKDKNRFYLLTGVISLTVWILISAACFFDGNHVSDFLTKPAYYQQNPCMTLWLFSIVFLIIPLYYLFSKRTHGKTLSLMQYVSYRITRLYVLQWLVINYSVSLMEILQISRFSAILCIPVGILITVICILISCLLDKKSNVLK